jgi:hypothetical protein
MSKLAIEAYLNRVLAVVETMLPVLTLQEAQEVRHLIEHDEPAEGLRTLAWIIFDERKPVSLATIEEIGSLTSGLIDPEHMPTRYPSTILR